MVVVLDSHQVILYTVMVWRVICTQAPPVVGLYVGRVVRPDRDPAIRLLYGSRADYLYESRVDCLYDVNSANVDALGGVVIDATN